jgi:hypothetical protein
MLILAAWMLYYNMSNLLCFSQFQIFCVKVAERGVLVNDT